jgi:hypothetical protein
MKQLPVVRLNEQHFEREDGSRFAHIYQHPIYYHSNGKLKHIDECKLEIVNGEISNLSDELDVKVKGHRVKYKVNGKTATTEFEGLYVDDTLIQAPKNVEPKIDGNTIIWEDIFDNVDIKLEVTPYRTNEYIILKKNPLIGKGVDGTNLTVRYKKTGRLTNKTPFANSARGYAIPVVADDTSKGLSVRYLFSYEYPITIDPTTSPIPSSDAIINAIDGTANLRTDTTYIRVYYYSYSACGVPVTEEERSYARFDISTLAGKTINSANVNFYVYTAGTMNFTIRQVTAEVDPETGAIQTVYNNAAGTTLATITNPGTVEWKQATVTSYVDTHKGGFCDFGICPTGVTNGGYAYIASSEYSADTTKRPYLFVDYQDDATPAFIPQIIFI